MKPKNIGFGFFVLCGAVAMSAFLFAPRFKSCRFWRGSSARLSLSSRLLICIWFFAWTVAAFIGIDGPASIVPMLLSVPLIISYSSDLRRHSEESKKE